MILARFLLTVLSQMLTMMTAGGLGERAQPLEVRLESYLFGEGSLCLPQFHCHPPCQGHLMSWVNKGELGLDGEAPHKAFVCRHESAVLETRKRTAREPSEAAEAEGKCP